MTTPITRDWRGRVAGGSYLRIRHSRRRRAGSEWARTVCRRLVGSGATGLPEIGLEGLAHACQEPLLAEGLPEERDALQGAIAGARLASGVARHREHPETGAESGEARDQVAARHDRQDDIREEGVGRAFVVRGEGARVEGVRGGDHGITVPREGEADERAYRVVVLDAEHSLAVLGESPGGGGRTACRRLLVARREVDRDRRAPPPPRRTRPGGRSAGGRARAASLPEPLGARRCRWRS